MLSVRSTVICAISLIAVVSLIHEFASSKELSQLLRSTIQVEGSTSIRFRDNPADGHGDSGAYPPEYFCVDWSEQDSENRTVQPIDEWWTHHVEYDIVSENATHHCFEREIGSDKSFMHIQLYHNQFHTSCERVHKRYLWSSGWGADFKNVIGGFEEALDKHHVPFVMSWNPLFPKGWHYAANKGDFSNKTCPEQDLSCYFVPYHPCGKDNEVTNNTVGKADGGDIDFVDNPNLKALHVYQYVTRPLLWLRRSIFNYIEQQNLGLTKGECSVIHVRRSDVVLHGGVRKYYPVKDYVDLLPPDVQQNHEILLLTDDLNAIEEAHEFFPKMKWRYLDRPRHNGTSGGWENQTPSRNPAGEVITILGTFEMVKNCVHFVHGEGAFSSMLWAYMKMQHDHDIVRHRVDIDGGKSEIGLLQLVHQPRSGDDDDKKQEPESTTEQAQPGGEAQPKLETEEGQERTTEEAELETDLNKLSVEELEERLEQEGRRRLRIEEKMWPLGPTFETELGR